MILERNKIKYEVIWSGQEGNKTGFSQPMLGAPKETFFKLLELKLGYDRLGLVR
jgi:hypothetical protein